MFLDFYDIAKYAALLVMIFLVGCSVLDRHQATTKLAIQYATLRYIDEDADKAERVRAVVADARELAATATTVDAIDQAIRESIEWEKLSDADKILAVGLLDMIRAELEFRIGHELLNPDQLVAVGSVLDWVDEAAGL